MTRSIDIQTKTLMQDFESCRLVAYQDEGGVWTIGWGHTGPDVKEGMNITQQQADALFDHDIHWAQSTVEDLVKVPLTDNEFGALVSLTFNIGQQAFKDSTLLKILNTGDYNNALAQFAVWDKIEVAGVKIVDPGLVKRRKQEMTLWLTPDKSLVAIQAPATSVMPSTPKLPALMLTKVMMGVSIAGVGTILSAFVGMDFTPVVLSISQFSDLGPWVRYLALGITLFGLAVAAYGRIQARLKRGI